MTVNKLQLPAKQNAVQQKINEIIDNLGGGGAVDQTYDPTSANAQSGIAIAGALVGKEDVLKVINILSTSGTITLADNSINTITPTANIAFILPTITDNTVFHQILVQLKMTGTVYTIDLGLGSTPHYFNSSTPDLSSAGVYNILFEYDKANQYWVGGVLRKGTAQ